MDRLDDEVVPISFLLASLNAPVYISVPVQDARIVDEFLEQLDTVFAEVARRNQDTRWWDFDFDDGVSAALSIEVGNALMLLTRDTINAGIRETFIDEEL